MLKKLFFPPLFLSSLLFASGQQDYHRVIENIKHKIESQSRNYKLKLSAQQIKFLQKHFPTLLKQYQETVSNLNKKDIPAIFYFTSTSVPIKDMENILISINKLKNEFEIEDLQVFNGIDFNNFANYQKQLEKDRKKDKILDKAISHTMLWRLDSNSFKKLKLNKVPAIAFAMCNSNSIYPSDCDIKYIMRGDKSLLYFFHIVSEKDKNYLPYYNALVEAE